MRPLCRVVPATALSGVLLFASAAFGQQPDQDQPSNPPRRANPPGQADQPRQPGQPGQPGQPARRQPGQAAQGDTIGDDKLAACLILDNNKEIALAQFAQQKTQNEQVKSFAEKIAKDHQQFVQQLQEAAKSGGISPEQLTLRGGAQSPAGEKPGQADPQRTETRPGAQDPQAPRRTARPAELDTAGRSGQGASFIDLKQELTEQCLQTIRQELEQKPEAEFDKCYIGSQVMAHMGMVDTLEVFSRHASPELKSVLEKGKQTAQMHLDEAKKLAQQLEKGAPEGRQRERANP